MSREEAATTIISAQVNVAVRRELERRALEADRTLSAEVRRAIHEHLRRTAAAEQTGTNA
jgi:post-segregation antitoxin (ccd killing protein)